MGVLRLMNDGWVHEWMEGERGIEERRDGGKDGGRKMNSSSSRRGSSRAGQKYQKDFRDVGPDPFVRRAPYLVGSYILETSWEPPGACVSRTSISAQKRQEKSPGARKAPALGSRPGG